MDWIILFIVSWVLFFLLIDLKKLKINIWCGILATLMQLLVDNFAINHGLYIINNPVVKILGSSIFFDLGPIFIIGLFLAQFHPVKRVFVIINVLFLTLMYSFEEWLFFLRGSLVYVKWNLLESIFVNFGALTVLSWFSVFILNKSVVVGK